MADAHKNFAASLVATAPAPATSGTSLVVTAGEGARFPAAPFNATVFPATESPSVTNAEIVRVTAVNVDTLTIVRSQESTTARAILVGDRIMAGLTAKSLTDIETSISDHANDTTGVHGIADTSDLILEGDPRLSDDRDPTLHASSHGSAGSDPIAITQAQVTGLTAALAAKADDADLSQEISDRAAADALLIPLTQKGAASGVATLDSGGQVPAAQIPAIAITEYLGTVASEAAMLALVGQKGDWAIRSDEGKVWIITGADPSVLAGWTALDYPASAVVSVNSLTGAVVLDAAAVGADPAGTGASQAAAVRGLPLGLTGATLATRFVGATASGAPSSGTFVKGDFVVARDQGAMWVCFVGGTPGTWLRTGVSFLASLSDVDLTGLADGDTLVWDETNTIWVPGAGGGGGGAGVGTIRAVTIQVGA